jgi:hypothetical protein
VARNSEGLPIELNLDVVASTPILASNGAYLVGLGVANALPDLGAKRIGALDHAYPV